MQQQLRLCVFIENIPTSEEKKITVNISEQVLFVFEILG
jgi:hypothetical protein